MAETTKKVLLMLTESQHAWLKKRAYETGLSMSRIVRILIDTARAAQDAAETGVGTVEVSREGIERVPPPAPPCGGNGQGRTLPWWLGE